MESAHMAAARCSLEASVFKQQMLFEFPGEAGAGGNRGLYGSAAASSRVQQQAAVGSFVPNPQALHWTSTAPPHTNARRRLSPPLASRIVRRAAAVSNPTEVRLESVVGVSYEELRDRLAAGEWEMADAETRRLLCILAGEAAAKRKWVYFSEVQFIPSADLRTIDGLWRAYSNNKFGYSVQRRIWRSTDRNWSRFFRKVGWTRFLDEKNEIYRSFPSEFMWDLGDPTPEGHLPLTNALRGTQLLEKVLIHPAFDGADEENEINVLSATSFNTLF